MPIHSYIKSYRMQSAARLLRETKVRITEISLKVGYANPSNFSDAFRKELGMLPSDYRNSPSK